MDKNAIIRRSAGKEFSPSRRPGLAALPMLSSTDTPSQNIVLMQMEEGATVDLHPVKTDESLYVLEGEFTLVLPEGDENLCPGDLAFFPDKSEHGLKCDRGPGKFLLLFAPPVL